MVRSCAAFAFIVCILSMVTAPGSNEVLAQDAYPTRPVKLLVPYPSGGTNDVVVKRDGSIYFTDTYGGFRLREKDPKKELDFNAVYMLRSNKLSLLINDIPNTNGLAFSPDEKFLYVNGSRDRFLKRYEVAADGTLKNGTMLIDMNKDPSPGITDGLRVDTRGNIWETGPGGVWVISPEGKHLGTIRTPELAANVEFGDADRKTLYIAARTSIYKVRVNVAGMP